MRANFEVFPCAHTSFAEAGDKVQALTPPFPAEATTGISCHSEIVLSQNHYHSHVYGTTFIRNSLLAAVLILYDALPLCDILEVCVSFMINNYFASITANFFSLT